MPELRTVSPAARPPGPPPVVPTLVAERRP
jgi:hypothetical protein